MLMLAHSKIPQIDKVWPISVNTCSSWAQPSIILFLIRYPNESEYQDYISKNSGQTNAFTSETNTNYYFSVANNALNGALDRFAQFFIAPLFSETCTEREMKAVDSEYNLNLQNDFWRKFQLFHNASGEQSPYCKFMIGNLLTLQHPDTRQRLLDFHTRYYSANVMKLVVYGSQPIQDLEEWTTQLFSPIQNKDLNPPSYNEVPFNKETLPQFIKYVPIKNQDYLEINWIMDYLKPLYRNCPGKYISHLLGHEGENSLLSHLIKEDLAQELSCGPNNDMKCFSTMSCRIKLTKKGLQHYDKVLSLVFQYIQLLKNKGNQKWIFDEIKDINRIQFDFLEKQNPFQFVCTLASRLQQYPVEEVLRAPYLMETYDQDMVQKTINQLGQDNVIIFLSSQEFAGKLGNKEKYFGTEYLQSKLDEGQRQAMQPQQIHASLNLPPKNIYVPKHTEVLPESVDKLPAYPVSILENEQTQVFFKQDDTFKVPKTVIQLKIYTIGLGYGKLAQTEILARIWMSLLKNHTRELNYLAEMAKLDPSIQLAPNGLEISISGFSESIQTFALDMFNKILSFKVQEYQELYESTLLKIRQDLENFHRLPPYQQVHSFISVLLRDHGAYDPKELIAQLDQINFQDVIHFNNHFLRRVRFEWLIQGNLTENEAKQIALGTEKLFNAQVLAKDQILQIRALNLPKDIVYNYTYHLTEPTETNSGVVVHYQQENGSLKIQLINDILSNILKSPFFAQLRTVEQLGYAVFSLVSDIRGISGFSFVIQSNGKCPNYVQERIRLFLNNNFKETLEKMTSEQFEEYRASVKVSLLEKDYSLNKEAGRFWLEIQKHQNLFDRRQRLLELLPSITMEEVVEYFLQHFIRETRQFEIHAVAPTHKEEQKEVATTNVRSESIEWLKRRIPLYPDYYSTL